MKIKTQQLARKQSPLGTLQTNLMLPQPSVSSTGHCEAHKSREPAVTARGSCEESPPQSWIQHPGSCLARATQVGINTSPGLLGYVPSNAAQNTVCLICEESILLAQLLVIRANIQLAEAGTDQSFLKSSQGVGGHRIWPSLNDS